MDGSRAGALGLAFGLIITACGGADAASSSTGSEATSTTVVVTAAPTPTITSSSEATTSTSTPPSTTSAITTSTTVPSAPAVEGWDGDGVHAVDVVVVFEPALAALDMEADVRDALDLIGVRAVGDAAAVLTFDLAGTPLSDIYGVFGRCYTGSEISGQVVLAAPGLPVVAHEVSFRLEPIDMLVFRQDCSDDPDDSPYSAGFRPALVGALGRIWGPSSVPYLIDVLDHDVRDSHSDYPHWAAAMDAFRRLDDSMVSESETREFLDRVITVVAHLVETGHTPHGADTAARRVLEAYAGTDFGVATAEDVRQWRDWFDGWEGP